MKEYILAIETGGTKLQLVLGDAEGNVAWMHRTVIHPELGSEGILRDVLEVIPLAKQAAQERGGTLSKIGVGFGGPVDSKAGVIIESVHIKGWTGYPLADTLREKTGVPTYLYNDTNAAAWGEYKKGSGVGTMSFFYTNIGSGIGGGWVCDGKLYDGQGCGAAEFGQTWLMVGEEPRTVESLCSGWSIARQLKSSPVPEDSLLWTLCGHDAGQLDTKLWGQAVAAGDAYALSVLEQMTDRFSYALANAINMFSPEVVAIGGGVSLIGDPLIDRLSEKTAKKVFVNNRGRYRIVRSELDEMIVPIGVLLLTGEKEKGE